VASWSTKRRWVDEAFEALQKAGYTIGSAYTAVRNPERTKFIYRDRLWQGADLAGLGVASFGHVNGVHMQNLDRWETYSEKVREGTLPLSRAYRPDHEERLIRELVLQLKLGRVRPAYFEDKYGADILRQFEAPLRSLKEDGYLSEASSDLVSLTRAGLLRIDSLLPRFFQPKHAGIRYT
jgi:oxygen-independent coproporphyrinogen-3 oxidase